MNYSSQDLGTIQTLRNSWREKTLWYHNVMLLGYKKRWSHEISFIWMEFENIMLSEAEWQIQKNLIHMQNIKKHSKGNDKKKQIGKKSKWQQILRNDPQNGVHHGEGWVRGNLKSLVVRVVLGCCMHKPPLIVNDLHCATINSEINIKFLKLLNIIILCNKFLSLKSTCI